MSLVNRLIRKNIVELIPYTAAREEFSDDNAILLDANENPYDSGANRYPDPLQTKVKVKISQLKNIPYERIFLGNGSDELRRQLCPEGLLGVIVETNDLRGERGIEVPDLLAMPDREIDAPLFHLLHLLAAFPIDRIFGAIIALGEAILIVDPKWVAVVGGVGVVLVDDSYALEKVPHRIVDLVTELVGVA